MATRVGPHPLSYSRWPQACAAVDRLGLDLKTYADVPEGPLQLTVSGGRSSQFQAAMIILANGGVPPNAVITFQNTGLEAPEALAFVDAFDRYFSAGVNWLERRNSSNTRVAVVSYSTASREGEPFEELFTEIIQRRDGTMGPRPLPNPAQRVCTAELKMKTAHRFLTRHLGWRPGYTTTIGFRADEEKRVKKRRATNTIKCPEMGGRPWLPMYDADHNAGHVLSFWRAMSFDLEADSDWTNCELCFMKGEGKIKEIMWRRPRSVPIWIRMEAVQRDRSMRFRQDRPSYLELHKQAQIGDFSGGDGKPCRTCMG